MYKQEYGWCLSTKKPTNLVLTGLNVSVLLGFQFYQVVGQGWEVNTGSRYVHHV